MASGELRRLAGAFLYEEIGVLHMTFGNYELDGAFLPEHIAILKSVGFELTPQYSYNSEGQRVVDPNYAVPCHPTEDINDNEDWAISQKTLVFLFDIPLDRLPPYLVHHTNHDVPRISKEPALGAQVWKDAVFPIVKKRLELGV